MEFEFEGQKYQVSAWAGYGASEIYDKDYALKLPDGRFLKVVSWLECIPPIPKKFEIVPRKSIRPGWVLAVLID